MERKHVMSSGGDFGWVTDFQKSRFFHFSPLYILKMTKIPTLVLNRSPPLVMSQKNLKNIKFHFLSLYVVFSTFCRGVKKSHTNCETIGKYASKATPECYLVSDFALTQSSFSSLIGQKHIIQMATFLPRALAISVIKKHFVNPGNIYWYFILPGHGSVCFHF